MSVTVTLNGAMETWISQARIQLSNQPTVVRNFENFNVDLMGYCDQGKSIDVIDFAFGEVMQLYRNYAQISSSPQTQITWGNVVWIIDPSN